MPTIFQDQVFNGDEIANRMSAAQTLYRGQQVDAYISGIVFAKWETIILREWAPIIGFRRDRHLRTLGITSTMTVRIQLYNPVDDTATEPYVIVRPGTIAYLRIDVK